MRRPLSFLVTLVCLPILLAGPFFFVGSWTGGNSWGVPKAVLQTDTLLQVPITGFSRSEELPRIVASRISHAVFLIIFILLLLLYFDRPDSSLRISTIGSSTSRRW